MYPAGSLISELTNRWAGSVQARRVAWVGLGIAAVLSSILATPRIASSSSSAFLVSQMLDVAVFKRLRRQAWWRAPLVASVVASVIDTFIFFLLAFGGTHVPWLSLAARDLGVKLLMATVLLLSYRFVADLSDSR